MTSITDDGIIWVSSSIWVASSVINSEISISIISVSVSTIGVVTSITDDAIIWNSSSANAETSIVAGDIVWFSSSVISSETSIISVSVSTFGADNSIVFDRVVGNGVEWIVFDFLFNFLCNIAGLFSGIPTSFFLVAEAIPLVLFSSFCSLSVIVTTFDAHPSVLFDGIVTCFFVVDAIPLVWASSSFSVVVTICGAATSVVFDGIVITCLGVSTSFFFISEAISLVWVSSVFVIVSTFGADTSVVLDGIVGNSDVSIIFFVFFNFFDFVPFIFCDIPCFISEIPTSFVFIGETITWFSGLIIAWVSKTLIGFDVCLIEVVLFVISSDK